MPFDLDRVDGMRALPSLRPDNVSVEAEEASVTLWVAADHEIALYFPATDGLLKPQWLELAADILTHLREIDNEVQRSSAEQWKQWKGKPCPSSYFEGALAYITLVASDEAVLRYWVMGCNSEWDERFMRKRDGWHRQVEDA